MSTDVRGRSQASACTEIRVFAFQKRGYECVWTSAEIQNRAKMTVFLLHTWHSVGVFPTKIRKFPVESIGVVFALDDQQKSEEQPKLALFKLPACHIFPQNAYLLETKFGVFVTFKDARRRPREQLPAFSRIHHTNTNASGSLRTSAEIEYHV